MELLRLLVKVGPKADLRRLLFSSFSMVLSFLEGDAAGMQTSRVIGPTATSAVTSDNPDQQGVKHGNGGRRLYFATPVARLMGVVVDSDVTLVTSISDDNLTQLVMAATRSR